VAIIAQRNGVRVVAFQKCGSTSIINMFLTPAGMPLIRGTAPALNTPSVRNTGDEAAAIGGHRGDAAAAQDWPKPELTIAFFRNPLMRILSAYEHFLVRTVRDPFLELGFTTDMDFPKFCLHLRNIDLSIDNHLKPQIQSYTEASGLPPQVYGGQLEQLDITWPLLVEQYGLDCTLEIPQYNAAEYETEGRLTGARLDLFKQLYAADYRMWEASHFETRAPISSVCH